VKREGHADLLEIQMVRDTIRLPSVKGDSYKPDLTWEFMLDDERKIGYVRLTQLGKESPKEMESALAGLVARGMKALILDLRNNPGGTLAEAVSVADLFVESGRIVTVKGRSGEKAYDATAEGTFAQFPIALLVNRQTASAAEIIAACLQDHGRAVVIGERTFGQALVRSMIPLEGGAGALRLPVAAYYRPNGKNVNRFPDSTDADDWGVKPDRGYEISLSDADLKLYEKYRNERDMLMADTAGVAFQDLQLQKAFDHMLARSQ
jgi:carboxyl-terminal processing protease